MARTSEPKEVSPDEAVALINGWAKTPVARRFVIETVQRMIPNGGQYTSDKLDAMLAEHFGGAYQLGAIHGMKWTQLAAMVEAVAKARGFLPNGGKQPAGGTNPKETAKKKQSRVNDPFLVRQALLTIHNVDADEYRAEPANQSELLKVLNWNDKARLTRAMTNIFGKKPMGRYKRACASSSEFTDIVDDLSDRRV